MLDGLHLVGGAGLGWEVTGTQEQVSLRKEVGLGGAGPKMGGASLGNHTDPR